MSLLDKNEGLCGNGIHNSKVVETEVVSHGSVIS